LLTGLARRPARSDLRRAVRPDHAEKPAVRQAVSQRRSAIPVVSGRVVRTARQIQVSGPDRTLLLPTAFTGGFKADPLDSHGRKHRALFGPSLTAFGQPGAGGSHAFADPENGLSFAYVMNQMELGILPNRKSMELVAGVYG
jgi:hypothetical protein